MYYFHFSALSQAERHAGSDCWRSFYTDYLYLIRLAAIWRPFLLNVLDFLRVPGAVVANTNLAVRGIA